MGWKNNGTVHRSSLWNEANPSGFLAFGPGNHKALGINDHGEIVGLALHDDHTPDEGFFWNGGSFNAISGGLGHDYFPFAGINNEGLTAGQSATTAHGMLIGDLSSSPIGKISESDLSIALGLNDNDLIVGESSLKGFAYDLSTGVMHNMNDFSQLGLQVGSILRLTDINNANVFVGVALVGGIEHGILGHFVPEPSALVLLLFTIPCCARVSRPRARSSCGWLR